MDRFIKVKDIPPSLWSSSSQILSLPKALIDLWKELLRLNNLEDMAMQKSPKGFTGGISKEATDKHLAWRYTGSCARVVMTMLDPKNNLSEVADAYAKTFAANKVLLADLPCGAGAGALSIVSTLIVLRKAGVLPRLPLTIKIVAAELSEYALGYYVSQVNAITPIAEEQAISIEYETLKWDALDKIKTANLTQQLTLASQGCDSRLLLLTNFSGFLDKEQKWKMAEPQFEQIFIHSRDKSSTAVWIEPGSKNIPAFFQKITVWFNALFKKLLKSSHEIELYNGVTTSHCQHPLKDHKFPVNLNVRRFQLPTKD